VTILVDHGERRSGVPDLLEAAGASVRVVSLGVADYMIAAGIGVERKTAEDLLKSILTGRLWNQVARLRTLPRPYVIVEGRVGRRPGVKRSGVQGALLEIVDNGIVVLSSYDARDTARWLVLLARRAGRDSFSVPQRRRRSPRVTTSVGLLASVPGISTVTAQRLLDTFGSVAGVASASVDDLMRVPGLGSKRATQLKRVL
jgi:ERCC4-type nuclease